MSGGKAHRVVKKGGYAPPANRKYEKLPIPKPARPTPVAPATKTVETQNGEPTK